MAPGKQTAKRRYEMKASNCRFRPIGQRSITSAFHSRVSNRSTDCERNADMKVPNRKGTRPSLSEFLNRNLHRSSALPTSVQGKGLPFLYPVNKDTSDKCVEEESLKKEEREAESKFSIDGAFDMFKKLQKDPKGPGTSCPVNDTDIFFVDNIHETRKKRNMNEGHDGKPSSRKRLAVLGEDSKPAQRPRRKHPAKDESIPLFNHYENGGGWWNDNMAGVDTEEIGYKNEAWEGVGHTTLGGIEWH